MPHTDPIVPIYELFDPRGGLGADYCENCQEPLHVDDTRWCHECAQLDDDAST